MLSFTNAKTNAIVTDRKDRTNVAGICQLGIVGLHSRTQRAHARRVLGSSAPVRSYQAAHQLAYQSAIHAVMTMLSTAMDLRRAWRPERPFRLLAFACPC